MAIEDQTGDLARTAGLEAMRNLLWPQAVLQECVVQIQMVAWELVGANVETEPRAEACRRESARATGWAALRQLLDGGWIVKLATKLTPVTASPVLHSV